MSQINNIPSEKELEAWANSFFQNYGLNEERFSNLRDSPKDLEDAGLKLKNTIPESNFSVGDPQTSLRDPFFTDGNIPNAVSRSNNSSSSEQFTNDNSQKK